MSSFQENHQKQIAFPFSWSSFPLPTEAVVYIIMLVWNWLSPLTWSGANPGWQMCCCCGFGLMPEGPISVWSAGPSLALGWHTACEASKSVSLLGPGLKQSGSLGRLTENRAALGSSPKNLWNSSLLTSVIKWDAAEMGGRVRGCAGSLAAVRQMSLLKYTPAHPFCFNCLFQKKQI